MPPAFNLSQDQTLQFDLFTSNSIDVGPIPLLAQQDKTLRLHPLQNESDFSSREHLTFPSSPSETGLRQSP
jgi:hypothetical protein